MATTRKPQQTPRAAVTQGKDNDDFTLPASLYYDSVCFLAEAEAAAHSGNIYRTGRFMRASVWAAFAFLEAALNQAAEGHAGAHATKLPQFEVDVLEEQETVLGPNGHVLRKTKYYPFESRFSFLIQFLSGKEFDKSSMLWARLKQARKVRDVWTHPRPPFDTWSLTLADVKNAVEAVRDVILEISRLMGSDPQLWLVPIDEVKLYCEQEAKSG